MYIQSVNLYKLICHEQLLSLDGTGAIVYNQQEESREWQAFEEGTILGELPGTKSDYFLLLLFNSTINCIVAVKRLAKDQEKISQNSSRILVLNT